VLARLHPASAGFSVGERANTVKSKPTKRRQLCRVCVIHRDQPLMKPTYLVHPVSGEVMLFDVHGEAVCPDCGARYRRTLNVIALVE
jgi:hypothetical protein